MHAVYPGSFDPVTNGHLDIIERASKMYEHLTVAVLNNVRKQESLFSRQDRCEMLLECVSQYPNVTVDYFEGLLINYMQCKNARVIVRGLRAISDFEYEFQINSVNKKLCPEVETVFIMASNEYSYLSSSIVKEVAYFGGCIEGLVPDSVKKRLANKGKIK